MTLFVKNTTKKWDWCGWVKINSGDGISEGMNSPPAPLFEGKRGVRTRGTREWR
jgi:hypothetical protein